jgi:signal peptidase
LISRELKVILILTIVVVAIFVGSRIALGTLSPVYVVTSDSMLPTIKENDAVVVGGHSYNSLEKGDIIVFHEPGEKDVIIVHRIVDVQLLSDGSRTLRTKGDANPGSLEGTDYPIAEKEYLGKVIFVIPNGGLISMYIGYGIIATLILFLFFLILRRSKKGSPVST